MTPSIILYPQCEVHAQIGIVGLEEDSLLERKVLSIIKYSAYMTIIIYQLYFGLGYNLVYG